MAEPRGDKRGQFERFQSDGSIHVDSESPNRNILTNEQRPPLVEKPFNFRYNPINSRTTDLERFTKFLTTPGGLKMQANVALLQQSNRDLKETFARNSKPDGTLLGNVLRTAKEVVVDTIKTNVGFTATLAKQIPVNGTGTHFVNNLNGPTYLKQGGDPKSALGNFLKSTFGLPEVAFGLRLGGSGPLASDPESTGQVKSQFVDGTKKIFKSVHEAKDEFTTSQVDPTVVFSQNALESQILNPTDPNFGVSDLNLPAGDTNPSQQLIVDGSKVLNEEFAKGRFTRLKGNQTGLPGNDFIETQEILPDEVIHKVIEDKDGTIEGYTIAKNAIHAKLFEDGKDRIGQQVYKEVDTIDDTLENQEFFTEAFGKQLIPFSISNITPEKSYNLFFHAFLDDYSDTYSGNWNPQQYIGRGEEFYTYNNFTRAINFSFKAASFNKDSLLVMYDKLNLLAGATAPNYSPGGNFMRGTLSRITIGDLLYRQTGFISNLSLTWNNSYQWEINDREIEGVQGLPHVLDVGVQFTPIHNFNVKSDLDLKKEKFFGKRKLDKTKPTDSVSQPFASSLQEKEGIRQSSVNPDGSVTFSVTRTREQIEFDNSLIKTRQRMIKAAEAQGQGDSTNAALLQIGINRLKLFIPQD